MSVYVPSQGNYGNITIGNPGVMTGVGVGAHTISITGGGTSVPSSVLMSNGTGTTTWANNTNTKTTARGKLHLEGDDADIVMNGVSLKDLLNGITDRLSILQPKPELLEKYDNLRQAYEHYKTLEALLHQEDDDEK